MAGCLPHGGLCPGQLLFGAGHDEIVDLQRLLHGLQQPGAQGAQVIPVLIQAQLDGLGLLGHTFQLQGQVAHGEHVASPASGSFHLIGDTVQDAGLLSHVHQHLGDPLFQLIVPEGIRIRREHHDQLAIDPVQLVEAIFHGLD